MISKDGESEAEARLRAAHAAYQGSGSKADLDRWIAAYGEVIETLDPETADHGVAVIDLCNLLGLRWVQLRTDDAWNEAVEYATSWRKRVPPPDWRSELYILAHGVLLYRRADATETLDDIADAISTLEAARNRVVEGSGIDGTSSTYLANLRLRRYQAVGDPLDLECSIQDSSRVLRSDRARPDEVRPAAKDFAKAVLERAQALDSADDYSLAVEAARAALSQIDDPVDVGDLQSVLASALRNRFEHARDGDPSDLNDAIVAYEAALRAPDLNPDTRASRLDDLGNGHASRYRVYPSLADLDGAIDCSRRALELSSRRSPHRGRMYANLGVSLVDRGRLHKDLDQLAEAARVLRAGLSESDHSLEILARLNVGLADALAVSDALRATMKNVDEVIGANESALAAVLATEADEPVSYRLATRSRAGLITRRLIGALLQRSESESRRTEDLQRVIAVGESSKVVLLTEELLRRSLPSPTGVSEEDLLSEGQLLARLSAMDTYEIAPPQSASPTRVLRRRQMRSKVRTELKALWAVMALAGTEAQRYVELRTDMPTALLDALESRPADAGLLSVLEFEEPDAEGRWTRGVCAVLLGSEKSEPSLVLRVIGRPLASARDRLVTDISQQTRLGSAVDTWHCELSELLGESAPSPFTVIFVSPVGDGFGLPWQSLLERSGWLTTGRDPAPVIVVPSLALLAASGRNEASSWRYVDNAADYLGLPDDESIGEAVQMALRMPTEPSVGPLVVGDPHADLESASDEAALVASVVGVDPLLGPAATVAAVQEGFRLATLVHIAAHAQFDAEHPLDSSLQLADGVLSARSVVGQWNTADLAVLSACESASGRAVMGGEVVGLATALLRSGVSAVVASLWPVDDAATAYLMKTLYVAITNGMPLPAALASAMNAVRVEPGWDASYYWAAFVLIQRGTDANFRFAAVPNS